jgi:hypothetical protein
LQIAVHLIVKHETIVLAFNREQRAKFYLPRTAPPDSWYLIRRECIVLFCTIRPADGLQLVRTIQVQTEVTNTILQRSDSTVTYGDNTT